MLSAHTRLFSASPAAKVNGSRRITGAIRPQRNEASAAAADENCTSTSSSSSAPKKPKQPVTLAWVSADGKLRAEIEAFAGDDLLVAATKAAEACGDEPPQAGCFSGSCGICELTLKRTGSSSSEGGGVGLDGASAVVRSCITVVPAGYERVEVSPLPDDAIWGVDAWDT